MKARERKVTGNERRTRDWRRLEDKGLEEEKQRNWKIGRNTEQKAREENELETRGG